jgi:hypothetical protein
MCETCPAKGAYSRLICPRRRRLVGTSHPRCTRAVLSPSPPNHVAKTQSLFDSFKRNTAAATPFLWTGCANRTPSSSRATASRQPTRGLRRTPTRTHGRLVKFVPNEQVVEVDEFETEDPAMRGEMTITFTLADPNKVVEITDDVDATTASEVASESFRVVVGPTCGTVYRGVAYVN